MEAKEINGEYIKKFFNFGDSERDTKIFNMIMPRLRLREYAHNSFICRMGDAANEMYFIESGTVIVRGKEGEISGELQPGRYFGEYAAITGDKRMADIQARGHVKVYTLDKKALLYLIKYHPGVYAMFLRKVYEQSTESYKKLITLLNTKRGIRFAGHQKGTTLPQLAVNYCLVFFIFLGALLFAPNPESGLMHPAWLCSPIVFMAAYIIITKRALESLILTLLYVTILLSKLNFIETFANNVTFSIGEVADIILIVLLMGALTRLFAVSGSINALKNVIQQKIKSTQSTFITALLSMVFVALDEHLSILINGSCFKPLLDSKRVPREKAAMVMGITPNALCMLNPMSVNGIFLTGIIILSTGQKELFLRSVPFNFGSLLAIAFVLLLIFQKIPLVGDLRRAQARVNNGGTLWPEGTDISDEEEGSSSMGRLSNLILPVLVLVASSIIAGTLSAGVFQVNVLYGLVITLIFVFFLYCFQQFMSPEQFFKNMLSGFENMIMLVVILVIGKCFANGMGDLGFNTWLYELVQNLIVGHSWLLPSIIFCVFTLACILFDDSWAMFSIGIPIAAGLAVSMDGNIALYLGAVCAAGVIGSEISPGYIFFIGSTLGINPLSYYRAKLPYIITITILTLGAYTAAGYFGL